jgi:hypothetical protein
MSKQIAAIVEYDISSVKKEVASAWKSYKQTEKYGLKFGEVCFDWQQKLGAQGQKGKGLRPILDEVKIPVSTAYWWIDRYKKSIGLKEEKQEEQESTTARFDRAMALLERLYRDADPIEREADLDKIIKAWREAFAVSRNGIVVPGGIET